MRYDFIPARFIQEILQQSLLYFTPLGSKLNQFALRREDQPSILGKANVTLPSLLESIMVRPWTKILFEEEIPPLASRRRDSFLLGDGAMDIRWGFQQMTLRRRRVHFITCVIVDGLEDRPERGGWSAFPAMCTDGAVSIVATIAPITASQMPLGIDVSTIAVVVPP
jgi:hypothetical protein